MRKALSLILIIVMVFGIFNCVDFSAFATKPELNDIEIYKSQALLGVAYDEKSNAVEQCNNIFNYYMNDNLFSPSQNYLDICNSDSQLMLDYNTWKAYSLAASPSEIVNKVVKKEDYYESLIVAMYSKATLENDAFKKIISDKTVENTNSFIGSFCKFANVTEISRIADQKNYITKSGLNAINKSVSETFSPAAVGKITGHIGDIISVSNTIYDVSQRIALYGTMAELDNSTRIWISQMYNEALNSNADASLKTALWNLENASTDFSGAVLADITKASFEIANFAIDKVLDYGIESLVGSNPIGLAVLAGLKAGKLIANVFFDIDSICEQIYLMECIYKVESLSRSVINNCKSSFLNSQSLSNAQAFNYSVDCYFAAIIDLDIDCMESFLDTLYNGGFVYNTFKIHHSDYNDHIATLEELKSVRQQNYDDMISYFKVAIYANYPDEYDVYFGNKVLLKSIDFSISHILPPGYSAGYADIIEGDSAPVSVSFYPSNTTQKGYSLESSDQSILRTDGNRVVAVSPGTAVLTVCSTDNPYVYYSQEIKVGKDLGFEEEDTPEEYFKYTISNNQVTITGLVSGYSPTTLKIPSTIAGKSVKYIGSSAFYNCSGLTSIIIPDSVTSIGYSAFRYCSKLTSIAIGNSVTSIGNDAFSYCRGLKKVIIGNSVTSIGDGAFEDCSNLTSITIPDSVTSIGDGAFEDCSNLTSIIIPNSLTSISNYAFYNCSGLTSITIGNSVTSIGDSAFDGCSGLISVKIGDSVTSIGRNSFENCSNLTSITIPDSVISIDSLAFSNCNGLKELKMPCSAKIYYNSYTSYTYNSFNKCTNIEKVTLTKGTGTMQDYYGYKTYDIPYYIITPWYISRNNLKELVIEDGITSIGNYAFYNCSGLTSISIPDSVKHIGECAFSGCSGLTSIKVDSNNSVYDSREKCNAIIKTDTNILIAGCQNTIVPDSVTSIGRSAFEGCSGLTNITIPDSVTSICNYAFYNCSGLTSITIGNSVTSIGDYAFDGCSGLTTITIPDSVTRIGEKVFFACSSLTNITIPDSVTSIGDGAFSGCSGLTSIIIPNSLTSISNYAFHYCSRLKKVTIPNSVTSIGNGAFYYCNGLTSITIGNSVTSIGRDAFAGCGVLNKVNISSLESWCGIRFEGIESNPLYYSNNLYINNELVTDLVIPDSVTSIGNYAFYDCSSLTSITIPDSVTSIGNYAFIGCSSLTSITIPDSVISIDNYAFRGCSSLTDVYYTGSQEQWNAINGIEAYNENLSYINNASIHYNYDPSHVHDYTDVVTPPTCTELGYTTHTCECGDSYKDTYVDPLGHDFSDNAEFCRNGCGTKNPDYVPPHVHAYTDVVTAPTCTEQGYTTHTCECGDVIVDTYVSALGHTVVNDKAVAATCTKTGKTAGTHCSVCGEVLTAQTVTKALGHKWDGGKVTKKATPTATGIKTYTCKVCKAKKTATIAKCAKYTNTLTVKGKKVNASFAKLKKANQTIARNSVLSITKAQGKLTYAKTSGNKNITINKTKGTIQIKKGIKKGTYKIGVKVTAAGNATYKSASKTATITVVVK